MVRKRRTQRKTKRRRKTRHKKRHFTCLHCPSCLSWWGCVDGNSDYGCARWKRKHKHRTRRRRLKRGGDLFPDGEGGQDHLYVSGMPDELVDGNNYHSFQLCPPGGTIGTKGNFRGGKDNWRVAFCNKAKDKGVCCPPLILLVIMHILMARREQWNVAPPPILVLLVFVRDFHVHGMQVN